MAYGALTVRDPCQYGVTPMFLVTSRTVRILAVVRRTIVAGATRFIRHRSHARIDSQQPRHRLERLDMAHSAIVVDHRVGAGDGVGFVNKASSWPPGYGHQREAGEEDRPGQEVADS